LRRCYNLPAFAVTLMSRLSKKESVGECSKRSGRSRDYDIHCSGSLLRRYDWLLSRRTQAELPPIASSHRPSYSPSIHRRMPPHERREALRECLNALPRASNAPTCTLPVSVRRCVNLPPPYCRNPQSTSDALRWAWTKRHTYRLFERVYH